MVAFEDGLRVGNKKVSSLRRPSENVFYAYDSRVSKDKEALQRLLEQFLTPLRLRLDSYDTAQNGPQTFVLYDALCKKITESPFILIDVFTTETQTQLQGINPNIMFELGLSLGYGKDVVLFSRHTTTQDLAQLGRFRIYDIHRETSAVADEIRDLNRRNPSYPAFETLVGGPLDLDKTFAKLESEARVRVYVQDYPMSVMRHPRSVERAIRKLYDDEDERRKAREIHEERVRLFEESLNENDKQLYVLYYKDEIENAFLYNRKYQDINAEDVEEALYQVDKHIELVTRPNCHFACCRRRFGFIFSIFDNNIAVMESSVSLRESRGDILGTLTTIAEVVDKWADQFRKLWDISEKDREEIRQWLFDMKEHLETLRPQISPAGV